MQQEQDSFNIASETANNIFFPHKNWQAPKGVSFDYFQYRFMRPVMKTYYKFFKLLNPDTPWTTQASIVIFDKILNKEMIGLEYGSGKSTLFFAKKLKQLVSVEHNEEWYKYIKEELKKKKIKNVDYYFIPKKQKSTIKEDLNHEWITHLKNKKFSIRDEYQDYFNFVDQYPDQYFDFVLIDGRARVECTFNSLDKLKSKGILVLDNSERKRYQPVIEHLKKWPQVVTTNGLYNTTFWFKP